MGLLPRVGGLLEVDKNYRLLSQIATTEGFGCISVTKAKKSVSRFLKKSYMFATIGEKILHGLL